MSIVESLTGCLPPTHLQSCFYTTSTLYHILLPLSTHFLPNSFLILFSNCNILPPERSHTMMPLHHVPVLSLEKSKVLLPCSVFVFALSCTIIPTLEIQRPPSAMLFTASLVFAPLVLFLVFAPLCCVPRNYIWTKARFNIFTSHFQHFLKMIKKAGGFQFSKGNCVLQELD